MQTERMHRGATARVRWAALLLAGRATLVPAPALAGPPTDPAESPAPEDPDPLTEVRRLYREGQNKFDVSDYAGAAEAWSEASHQLPPGDDYAAMRTTLLYSIASAEIEAYDVDHDAKRLRRARKLLEQYQGRLGPDDDDAREQVRARVAQIEAHLAEAAAQETAPPPASAEGPDAAEPAPEPVGPTDALPNRRPLWIAGSISLALGAGLLGVMGWGLAEGEAIDEEGTTLAADPETTDADLFALRDRGTTMNRVAIGTGIGGGVLVAGGVALVVLGTRRPRASERAGAGRNLHVVPGWASLGVRGRF